MPDQITKNGPLLVDVCSVATPDKTYFVPQEFPGKTVHSFGAAYYYTADKNNGCQYWICDITLNHLSNTHFHQPRTGPDVPPKTGARSVADAAPKEMPKPKMIFSLVVILPSRPR